MKEITASVEGGENTKYHTAKGVHETDVARERTVDWLTMKNCGLKRRRGLLFACLTVLLGGFIVKACSPAVTGYHFTPLSTRGCGNRLQTTT